MIDISFLLSLNSLNFLMVQFFFLKHEGIKHTLSFSNRVIKSALSFLLLINMIFF